MLCGSVRQLGPPHHGRYEHHQRHEHHDMSSTANVFGTSVSLTTRHTGHHSKCGRKTSTSLSHSLVRMSTWMLREFACVPRTACAHPELSLRVTSITLSL